MRSMVRILGVLLFGALVGSLAAVAASAQVVANAAAVLPGAESQGQAGRTRLSEGAQISMGDVLTTNETGRIDLLFVDGTRIVVGPRSRLVIEEILMRRNGKAERFAVSAVGGTFRFITGKSPKSAYDITTPTATMGVRGTTFDFSVREGRQTNLVLLRGEVLMCGGMRCAIVRGRCTLAQTSPSGQIGGAASRDAKDETILAEFPFIVDQSSLGRAYRAPTGSCGEVARRVAIKKAARPVKEDNQNPTAITEEEPPTVDPEPEPEPEPEPPPAPDPEPETEPDPAPPPAP